MVGIKNTLILGPFEAYRGGAIDKNDVVTAFFPANFNQKWYIEGDCPDGGLGITLFYQLLDASHNEGVQYAREDGQFCGVAEDPVCQGRPADFAFVVENFFAEYADDFFENVFFFEELMRYGVGIDNGTAELCQLGRHSTLAGIHTAQDANHRFFPARAHRVRNL